MKTTILLFVFVLFSVSLLHAQIEKGRVQVGGNIGFNHADISNVAEGFRQKSTLFNVSPSAGVFYKTNKMYGAFLNFSYQENYISPFKYRTYGGGIFFRQYRPVAKKLYLLLDERGSYGYESDSDTNNFYHSQNVNATIQAGMAYDIAKRMQLELLFSDLFYAGYFHSSYGNSYNIGTSFENFTFSNIAFGFRYYLK